MKNRDIFPHKHKNFSGMLGMLKQSDLDYSNGVKIELFSREGQIFPGRSQFDIFPGKCKISKMC